MTKHRQRTFRKSRNTGRNAKSSRKMRKRSKRVRKTRKRGKRVANKAKHTIQKGGEESSTLQGLEDYQVVFKCVQTLDGHSNGVNSAQYSTNGKMIVSASRDKTVRVWDMSSGECVQILAGHSGWVYCAQYSPDGQKIVTASADKKVRVWVDAKMKCVKRLALACSHHERLGSDSPLLKLSLDILEMIALRIT